MLAPPHLASARDERDTLTAAIEDAGGACARRGDGSVYFADLRSIHLDADLLDRIAASRIEVVRVSSTKYGAAALARSLAYVRERNSKIRVERVG